MNNKLLGVLFGVVAAVSYGTNPLFSLPLYTEGMDVDSVLFYRFSVAALILGTFLVIKGKSLKITKHEVFPLLFFGVMFSFSSLFLFQSFHYIDAGIASTILFVYPVIVAAIMILFFNEKASIITLTCIALSLAGIGLLYKGDGETALSTKGLVLVALSALSYSLYIVGVNNSSLKKMPTGKMTFWVIAFGSLTSIVRTGFLTHLQTIPSTNGMINVIGLALVPTVISILFINIAVKHVGATFTATIGALEPVTALIIGVLVFQEQITARIVFGVLLILVAVTFVVAGEKVINAIHKKSLHSNYRPRKLL